MSDDRYFGCGAMLAALPSLAVFIYSWWYCVDKYGFLLGFGLGWLPAGIAAALTFLAITLLWGLILALAGLIILFLLFSSMKDRGTEKAEKTRPPLNVTPTRKEKRTEYTGAPVIIRRPPPSTSD